jgi:hypothetical protein
LKSDAVAFPEFPDSWEEDVQVWSEQDVAKSKGRFGDCVQIHVPVIAGAVYPLLFQDEEDFRPSDVNELAQLLL